MLQAYDWPGNIRQLSNTIERSILVEDGSVIPAESISLPEIRSRPPKSRPRRQPEAHGEQEKEMIHRALEDNLWIQKDAASSSASPPAR